MTTTKREVGMIEPSGYVNPDAYKRFVNGENHPAVGTYLAIYPARKFPEELSINILPTEVLGEIVRLLDDMRTYTMVNEAAQDDDYPDMARRVKDLLSKLTNQYGDVGGEK
jgi:hypothetical protein